MAYTIVSSSPSFGHYSDAPVQFLRDGGYDVVLVEPGDTDALSDALTRACAWIAGFEPVDATTLERANGIRVVAKCGAGMDNFDFNYLGGRNIATVNVPGGNSDAVAEYTMGQILVLARGITSTDRSMRNGRWQPMVGTELAGRVLGVVGFGAIGRRVAALAGAFGMRVQITDPATKQAELAELGARVVTLKELLSQSDVVSLHVPLTDKTYHLIGAEEVALMRPDALLINNSRGGTVDEVALAEALTAGRLGGAALDVFEHEPLSPDSPLLATPNLLLSSHVAGYSDTSLAGLTTRCAQTLREQLDALLTR